MRSQPEVAGNSLDFLIAVSRSAYSGLAERAGMGEAFAPGYLAWMVDTVEAETSWPRDKAFRWLGFVNGAAEIVRSGVAIPASSTMLDNFASILGMPDPNDDNEAILKAANVENLLALEKAVSQASQPRLTKLVEAALVAGPAAKTSYCLGYVQAFATALGVIDVKGERDRTRAIYHNAYRECGYSIPPSRERTAAA